MKFFIQIIFTFLFFTHFNAGAQHVELNDQPEQFVEIKSVGFLENERWVLGGHMFSSDDGELYLALADSNFFIRKFSNPSQLKKSVDKLIISESGITGLLSDNNRYIFTTNVTQNLNGFYTIRQYLLEDDEEIFDVDFLPDGRVIAVGTKLVNSEQKAFLKIFNSNLSSLIYQEYSTPGYFSDILINEDSTFMVTGGFGNSPIMGGRKYNEYYEQVGEILESIPSDRIYRFDNGGYLILKNQELIKLDSNFQILTTTTFSNYGEIIDLEVDNENGFLLFQNEGEAPLILRINTDLEEDISFSIEDENFSANDLSLSLDKIGVGGYINAMVPLYGNLTPPSSSAFFKTYSKDGITENHEIDLEIIDVKIEDHERSAVCNGMDNPFAYNLNLKNIEVTFVNNGSVKINKATLFIEAHGYANCTDSISPPNFHYEKQDLSILRLEPGDTLVWRIDPILFPQKISDTSSLKICVWHTSVNNKRDPNLTDNYFCDEIILGKNEYVEPPIIEPTAGEYLLFPNPIKESMTLSLLQTPSSHTTIEFYDFLGRRNPNIYFIAPLAKYKEFDMSKLDPGVYIVRISNDLIDVKTKIIKK